jgi:hypothetical protein
MLQPWFSSGGEEVQMGGEGDGQRSRWVGVGFDYAKTELWPPARGRFKVNGFKGITP